MRFSSITVEEGCIGLKQNDYEISIPVKYNYDTIASFYDQLARLIFGRSLIKAQLYLLRSIPPGTNVLIVGGGTGWILDRITRRHPSGLRITYIDSSQKMIALARKRRIGKNEVVYISEPVEKVAREGAYDVVITSFLFDNFDKNTLMPVFTSIHKYLKPGGLWLYCDFQNTGIFWQRELLNVMYLFFRLFCGIKATRLPDIEPVFDRYQYRVVEQETYFKDFIISSIYLRQ